MSSEVFSMESELPELPEMSSPGQEYAHDLSASELTLLGTGNSPEWSHAPDDSGAGVQELNNAIQMLSPEAREELEFRAYGLTQVRSGIALDELALIIENRLIDEYDTAEAKNTAPDFNTVFRAVEESFEALAARHFSCR